MPALPSKYAVIGAGLAGSATAWHLASRGHEVTLLEQVTPGHAGGSSHGSARIFRYAYPEHLYSRMVVEAKPLWDEVEQGSGKHIITPTGALDFGTRRDPERLARVLGDVSVEHELLSARQAAERWPGFRFDTPVLWHPGAGVINAQAAVEAMVGLAVAQGAHLKSGWKLVSVDRAGAGYRLASADGDVVHAERLVVCAGGWLPELLPRLALPRGFRSELPRLVVRQEQAFHFPYRSAPGSLDGSPWPTFIHKGEQIQTYGLPGGRDAGFRGQKIAEYNGGRALTSASAQNRVVSPANRQRVTSYVRENIPALEPDPYAETTCLFTNAPDERFILDRAEGITVASPCSGHGGKFAPLVGRMAADLASAADTSRAFSVPSEFRVPARAA